MDSSLPVRSPSSSSSSSSSTVNQSPSSSIKKTRMESTTADGHSPGESVTVVVSVIIPAHDAAPFIQETLASLVAQDLPPKVQLEISIHDDGSTDETFETIKRFFEDASLPRTEISYVLSRSEVAGGPGRARNLAIAQSSGSFLCFNDADDVSLPGRVKFQLEKWMAIGKQEVLIGSKFERDPPDATWHYATFLNSLGDDDLILKSYRELTLIQPTWFMSRVFFDMVGGYREVLGEDLELFHRILDVPGVSLVRAHDEPLIVYRHLSGSVSSKTPRMELVKIKVKAFERRVLTQPHWKQFSVWGAGRDGRAFFEALAPEHRRHIREYVDVDANKIKSGFHHSGMILPVRHVSQVQKPFVVCVAMGRTGGALEANIAATGAIEGVDYWHFN